MKASRARIGVQTPPIPQGPEGGAPFLIADTLRLDDGRPREDLGRVLRRILVVRDGNGTNHRMESEHGFTSGLWGRSPPLSPEPAAPGGAPGAAE